MSKQTAIAKSSSDPTPAELMNPTSLPGQFTLSPSAISEMAGAGHLFEKVWKPACAGDGIRGHFLGEGPPLECTNALGETTKLTTWRIQVAPGMVARVIGDYQVDHELRAALSEGLAGQPCVLAFLGQVDTGKGRRANNWAISVLRKAAS